MKICTITCKMWQNRSNSLPNAQNIAQDFEDFAKVEIFLTNITLAFSIHFVIEIGEDKKVPISFLSKTKLLRDKRNAYVILKIIRPLPFFLSMRHFLNGPSQASFSFIFVCSNTHNKFSINKCEKCPSSIQCWDSNMSFLPLPLDGCSRPFIRHFRRYILFNLNVIYFSCTLMLCSPQSLSFSLSLLFPTIGIEPRVTIITAWAVVVVKWSACSPSTLTIQVRDPLMPTIFSVKFVFERTKINKKRPG